MPPGTLPSAAAGTREVLPPNPVFRRDAPVDLQATEDLMSQVQQGDMTAYQELVRLYQRRVFRVISSYHRNPEDAMEVVQDTFLKLYLARRTWERKTTFTAWLYRIAINASIDRYRRGGRQRTQSLEDTGADELQEVVAGEGPRDALDRLRHVERRRVLEEAVRRLPMRQREVVSLRYFGEMQLEEIAAALSCPLGTVKSNLHKGIIALKHLLLGQRDVLSYE
jgi:RNA polymerase sigma-70 factor, ECF subfamily